MLVLKCVHCRRQFSPAGSLAGRAVACPGCGHEVRVPTLSGTHPRPGEPTADWPPPGRAHDTLPAATLPASDTRFPFLLPPEAPGEAGRLGGYRVLGVLGSGGMGVVFRAEDVQLHRPVALKVMRQEFFASPDARQRFLREARSAAAVYHDHVVPIWQAGEDNGVPFLVMPLLEGESLGRRLREGVPLPVADIVRVGRQMAEGLAAAHAKGLTHRDIKPDNVFLEGESDRVRLLDFGLARAAAGPDRRLTHSGALVGTAGYMAPEQARSPDRADARSDLFSLGCVLYEMATGRRAFSGADVFSVLTSIAVDEPPDARSLNPDLPAGLPDLIHELLSKRPEARPASAAEVARRLREIETGHPSIPPARRWFVTAVLAAVAVLMGAASEVLSGCPGGRAASAGSARP